MAAKSSLKNMALCLTAVCALCAAILGGVYAMTYDPIQEAAAKALAESIGMVLPEGTLSEAQTAEFDGGVYEYYTSTAADGSQAFAVKSTVIGCESLYEPHDILAVVFFLSNPFIVAQVYQFLLFTPLRE